MRTIAVLPLLSLYAELGITARTPASKPQCQADSLSRKTTMDLFISQNVLLVTSRLNQVRAAGNESHRQPRARIRSSAWLVRSITGTRRSSIHAYVHVLSSARIYSTLLYSLHCGELQLISTAPTPTRCHDVHDGTNL
jgi:hypothetical protein